MSRFRAEPVVRRGDGVTDECRVYEGMQLVAYARRSRKTKRSVWAVRFSANQWSHHQFEVGEYAPWAAELDQFIADIQWPEVAP